MASLSPPPIQPSPSPPCPAMATTLISTSRKKFPTLPHPHHTQPWPLPASKLLLRKMGMNSIQISKSLLHGLNSRIFFPNPPCLDVATSLNMNCCSAECDISSQNFSVSRLFFLLFWESQSWSKKWSQYLGISLKTFSLKKTSQSRSRSFWS